MLPQIKVFVKNEWVVKAEGDRAQSLIDASDCALDPRALLSSATATIGPDGEIIEITPGAQILEIFSGLNSSERVEPPTANPNIVPAQIISKIHAEPEGSVASPQADD